MSLLTIACPSSPSKYLFNISLNNNVQNSFSKPPESIPSSPSNDTCYKCTCIVIIEMNIHIIVRENQASVDQKTSLSPSKYFPLKQESLVHHSHSPNQKSHSSSSPKNSNH